MASRWFRCVARACLPACLLVFVPKPESLAQRLLMGSEFFLVGNTPTSLGLGGALSTKIDSMDGLADNPIKNPDMLNRTLSLHYLGLNNATHGYGLSYSEPNAYGVLSFLYHGMRSGELELEQANSLQIAFSKRISRHYLFGTKINMDVFQANQYGVHMDANLIVVQDALEFGGWTLGERSFSFHLRHWGYLPQDEDTGGDPLYFRLPEARLGAAIGLFERTLQTSDLSSKAMVDLVFLPTQLKFHFHGGLQLAYTMENSVLKQIQFHAGFLLMDDGLVPNPIGPLTAGLQAYVELFGRLFGVKYAFVPSQSGGESNGFYHVFSLNFAAAYRDQEGPEIETFSD